MNFFSLLFLSFLFISLVVYYVIPKRFQWQFLLLISYVFLALTSFKTIGYILFSCLTTWGGCFLIGKIVSKRTSIIKESGLAGEQLKNIKKSMQKKKRLIFYFTMILNFGILAFLKYYNFAIGSIFDMLSNINHSIAKPESLNLLLPLGISFYTFQAMGYLIDVYNEKYKPCENFAKFALFLSFFPQITQGPIGRYDHLAPQLFAKHNLNAERIKSGSLTMLWGFFKKMAIADLSLPVVNAVFDTPQQHGFVIVIGVLFYSLQQYADFSGGIDIITGVAELFGIKLAPNFKRPYFSVSLSDFWRRWHISLGSWMRDYVFYPLAITKPMMKLGKVCKKKINKNFGRVIPAAIANIVVFAIVGIWHGAQWHYLMWGLYNGIVIAISDLLIPVYAKMKSVTHINVNKFGYKIFMILRTFIIVNIGWYFDRAKTLHESFSMMHTTLFNFGLDSVKSFSFHGIGLSVPRLFLIASCTGILFIVSVMQEKGIIIYDWLNQRNIVIRWCIYFALIFGIICISARFSSIMQEGFMYENF